MMCGITGTPGTGKSLIGNELARRGHTVIHLTDTVGPYVSGMDEERDTRIIDVDREARGNQRRRAGREIQRRIDHGTQVETS